MKHSKFEMPEPLLDPTEVCQILKIDRQALNRFVRLGKLPKPAMEIGAKRRWRPDQILPAA